MNRTVLRLCHWQERLNRLTLLLAPLADIVLRVWVAIVFFKSGLTKLQSLDTTIMLFTYEYQVPLLPPAVAAYLGTAAELVLPVLLILGLLGRVSATGLFFFNIVAAISYPEISEAGIRDHIVWGMLLLVLLSSKTPLLSLDYFLQKKFRFYMNS
jgi:putative oxidoreductase